MPCTTELTLKVVVKPWGRDGERHGWLLEVKSCQQEQDCLSQQLQMTQALPGGHGAGHLQCMLRRQPSYTGSEAKSRAYTVAGPPVPTAVILLLRSRGRQGSLFPNKPSEMEASSDGESVGCPGRRRLWLGALGQGAPALALQLSGNPAPARAPLSQSPSLEFLGTPRPSRRKITADGDCSREIKRRLLLERKVMTYLDSILKSRHYFTNKGPSSQGYAFSMHRPQRPAGSTHSSTRGLTRGIRPRLEGKQRTPLSF